MSLKKAIQRAEELLKEFNITKAPVPVEKIASKLGLAVVPFELGPSVSGALIVENGKATIGINLQESPVRTRFTIAHELGHFLLHRNSLGNSVFVDKKSYQILFRDEDSSTGEQIKEREANSFAAAILMPSNLLQKELNSLFDQNEELEDEEMIRTLAAKFKVSAMAMSYRLANLNVL